MDHCANCGHELGVGRYCTNCGHPVGARPAADEPPPAWTPPPPARYPLYADEVGSPATTADPAAAVPTGHRRRPWGLWVAAAAILALVIGIGAVLLLGTDDPADEQPPGAAPDARTSDDGPITNLAAGATVAVPATGAPGADVDGEPVTFDAENMLDGVPETAWRMPGDGTGEEIVITLARESRLRSVGLINGYAKKAAGRDWYHGNRRIERVQWVFDDGTTLDQELDDLTGVQSVDVRVTTTSITLRLLAVSEPGPGRDRRDNTVVSDLSLVGN